MSDDTQLMKGVEVEEAWLRQAMPADPPYSQAALKLRVRIAVHEAWLAGVNTPDPTPDLAGVKDSVRETIARQPGHDRHAPSLARGPRARLARWSLRVGGLAAAAAVLLAVLPQVRKPRPIASALGIEQRLDDFAAALIEAEAAPKWPDLETDVTALEETLTDSSAGAWNEEEIDDLSGELEALVSEIGQGS